MSFSDPVDMDRCFVALYRATVNCLEVSVFSVTNLLNRIRKLAVSRKSSLLTLHDIWIHNILDWTMHAEPSEGIID